MNFAAAENSACMHNSGQEARHPVACYAPSWCHRRRGNAQACIHRTGAQAEYGLNQHTADIWRTAGVREISDLCSENRKAYQRAGNTV